MSKYSFERLGSDRFEAMVQALLEKIYRVGGHLVQFGAGADGAREATWTQPTDHPLYKRPKNEAEEVPKEWVFQAKYHDIGLRGWGGARAIIENELDAELVKIVKKYKLPCHKYVLITNVPFSGVRYVGTRDRVGEIIKKWENEIPEIEVWDAVDLSRMLDADPSTRTTYLDAILPGDILRAMLHETNYSNDRRKSAFSTYLKSLLRSERDAKAEEAGDEEGLMLEKVFVDLDLKLVRETSHKSVNSLLRGLATCEQPHNEKISNSQLPKDFDQTPGSFALLRASHSSILLKGGPGSGKSTLTQFLALYHAARLIDPRQAERLARRLKLTGGVLPNELDYHIPVRFPLRIELRRYAQWIDDDSRTSTGAFLAQYVVERVNAAASASLDMDAIFSLAATNPLLLILDGLDEVPNILTRNTIFRELRIFLDRCEGESCDIQLILSSRPHGYRGEFDGFEPIEWETVALKRTHFDDYCNQWLQSRIDNEDERREAHQRIDEGMESPAVQQLAKTLLQATVMLTIVRRKHAIPHARHKLFDKYVDVIFERERNKLTVRNFETELRQLHELVGYELLCRMEQKKGERTIRSDEFRDYVVKVIEDYSSSRFDGRTISEIVDEISRMSKDRLCLLSGKGDDQDEIDFVIQPFREYFAAAYLAEHEDADPDKVYSSLVRRSHVWGDVLQFYAAFQNKAQQKNWISEADGTGGDLCSMNGLLNITRNRRALLQVLPEFERPKNEYIQRALINLLHPSTRWIWAGHDDTVAILLKAFSQDITEKINELFRIFSLDDHGNLFVELDLLAKLSSESDNALFHDTLNKIIADERTRSVGLAVAIENDIAVDLSTCSIDKLLFALVQSRTHYPYNSHFKKFANSLSIDQTVDLLVGSRFGYFLWGRRRSNSHSWPQDLWHCLHAREHVVSEEIDLLGHPFMLNRSEQAASTEAISCLENASSQFGQYAYKLLLAIANPTDERLDRAARESANLLDRQAYVQAEEQLGPDPSLFSSLTEWKTYKTELYEAVLEAKTQFRPILSKEPAAWLALLFHPIAWDEVRGFVSDGALHALGETKWAQVQRYLPGHVLQLLLSGWASESNNPYMYEVCQAVVKTIQKYGASCVVSNASLQYFFLSRVGGLQVSEEQAEELLKQATSLSALPGFWTAIIIFVCSQSPNIDENLFLGLWQRHPSADDFLAYFDLEAPKVDTKLILRLLKYDNVESVTLAAFLSPPQHGEKGSSSQLPVDLHGRLISHLTKQIIDTRLTAKERMRSLKALQNQPAHIEELRFWHDPKVLQTSVDNNDDLLVTICRKLRDIVGMENGVDPETLKKDLAVFVEKRQDYPRQIVLAAMESLLRIDEINVPALQTADWQGLNSCRTKDAVYSKRPG